MQIDRLLSMVFYIVSRERVTARELAEHFQVSTRTIYRDINTLTLANIPIISTRGSGGGIALVDGYTLDRSLFSQEEQKNILQALQMLQAASYPDAGLTLHKLGAIFGRRPEENWLSIDLSYWGSGQQRQAELSQLQSAIVHKRRVAFLYFSSSLQRSQRTVEPLQLAFKGRTWYLVGYCQKRQELRTFRLSRIKELRLLAETFTRTLPQDYILGADCPAEPELLLFKLRFAPEIAYKLYDDFQEDQVRPEADGSFTVTFPYPLSNWTFHYLLSFGRYVEVLEPAIARRLLRERALEIAALYKA
ncbi:MAG: YafY family transcriptional regulator [Angelakisella sp.]|jgi:predicted DNA-binding transcriptional regulator YafY|nr:YafY family transcriptional regulator [Angelakisella sp.]